MIDELDSCLEILVTIKECSTRSCVLDIILKFKDNRIITQKKIPFAVFREQKSVTYTLDKWIFIENRDSLIFLYTKADPGSNQVFIFDKKRKQGVKGIIPFLGYPIKMEGSEFFTKEFTHNITRETDGLLLKSTSKSEVKPGIIVIREIFKTENDISLISTDNDIVPDYIVDEIDNSIIQIDYVEGKIVDINTLDNEKEVIVKAITTADHLCHTAYTRYSRHKKYSGDQGCDHPHRSYQGSGRIG